MENLFKSLETIKLGSISLSSILSAVLLFIVSCIVIKILCRGVDKILSKDSHIDASLKGFLKSACKVALWVIAIIIIADSLGIPVTSLVAVLSVAGLALSLSVQGLLSNLFSGITLLFTRPFVVGDFVEISGNCGTVKEIGLFTTKLQTLQGQDITVYEQMPAQHFFLQPCSCQNTSETVECILQHPKWRLSLQTHKYIGIA